MAQCIQTYGFLIRANSKFISTLQIMAMLKNCKLSNQYSSCVYCIFMFCTTNNSHKQLTSVT